VKVDLIARSFNRERFIAEKKKFSLSLLCLQKSAFFFFLSSAEKVLGFVGVFVVTTTRTFFSQSSVKK